MAVKIEKDFHLAALTDAQLRDLIADTKPSDSLHIAAETVLHLREATIARVAALRAIPRYHSDALGAVTIPEDDR